MTKLMTAIFAWGAVYVAVTATLTGFQLAGVDMPLPVQTFCLTVVLVPTMMFVITPLSAKLARHVLR